MLQVNGLWFNVLARINLPSDDKSIYEVEELNLSILRMNVLCEKILALLNLVCKYLQLN